MGFFSNIFGGDAARNNRDIVSEARGMARPTRPQFVTSLDPSTGRLKEQLQLKDQGSVDLFNVQQKLRQEGMRAPGAKSQYALIAEQQQALEEQKQRQAMEQGAAGQQASAQANLATRGGLRSGSAERMASQGAMARMMGRQDIGMQGAQARAGIAQQDETSRQAGLQGLLGMETGERGYKTEQEKFNIQQAINEKRAKDAADMSAYNSDMAAYGGAQTARATAGGGKK